MGLLLKILIICGISGFSAAVILDVGGYGRIEGSSGISFYENRQFHAFLGLFYAKPPIGELRYLPPEPIGELGQNETDIWDATTNGPQCPQADPISSMYGGDENCLLLNVFTPQLPTGDSHPNLPVLFFIHGGAFAIGGAANFTPALFMDEDVVLVVIQYRLGPLGFLSLQTDEIPGNAGLFDQVEALRWVKNHVYDFGGDPERVTIFGESAGGASVSLLMLTPHAEGLFSGVIAQSGSALGDWAIDQNPVTRGQVVVDRAACFFSDDYTGTVDCLRKVPVSVLLDAFNSYSIEDQLNGGHGSGGSMPVVQTAGKLRYIEKSPVEMFETGEYNINVPAIYGATRDEGSFSLGQSYTMYLAPNGLLNDSYFLQNDLVRNLLSSYGLVDPTTVLSDTLAEKYLVGDDMTNFTSMIPGLTDLMGVFFMKAPCFRNTEVHSRHSPKSYLYSFDFQGRYSNFPLFFPGNMTPIAQGGVTHSDDLQYLFPGANVFNQTETEFSKRMLRIWTNFATYGEPTPEGVDSLGVPKWEPFSLSQSAYMSMDTEFTMRENYEDTYTVAAEGSRAGMNSSTTRQTLLANTSGTIIPYVLY